MQYHVVTISACILFHTGIELCDAVNEVITKVAYSNLSTFAGNLRLDENEVQHILSSPQSQCPLNEKYQRVIELWFRQDHQPTWENLRRALPPLLDLSVSSYPGEYRRESSTSMNNNFSLTQSSPGLTGKNLHAPTAEDASLILSL